MAHRRIHVALDRTEADIEPDPKTSNRWQPTRIHLTTTGAPATSDAASAHTANILNFTRHFELGVANNGNVLGITNRRDSNGCPSYVFDSHGGVYVTRVSLA